MKKIPPNVQSLLKASNQLNSHCKAVEELVYNALDADATCIAIRINIQENTIQVIDNGCGISSRDIKPLGHKYMTSKFIDLSTLKSAPNKYGFRGQALSSLINVSKSVKLVSRHEKSEGTWIKLFEHGQEKLIEKCNTRPSKGTTVEITGFLYNLNMQIRSNDHLNSLQSIKSFLEHISLVHCNISLSLRDDSRNEILFKIHKNRDIPQTLSTLYNIEKKNLQELQVEKKEYKVKAYIGKSVSDARKQYIFLNGKFISNYNSKLHKTVNNNLNKCIKQRSMQKTKIKHKITSEEQNQLIQKNVPDYFIFIKCPYMDYDLSNSTKQSVLEFKDWNQINKLLDKLIKFFNGDTKLAEVQKMEQNKTTHKPENRDTREQVKKIMERILGSHSKKTVVMNMHNGIKGKQVKRQCKKSSRTTYLKDNTSLKENGTSKNSSKSDKEKDECINNENNSNLFKKTEVNNASGNLIQTKYSKLDGTKKSLGTNVGKTYNNAFQKVSNNKESYIGKNMLPRRNNIDNKIGKQNKSKYKQDLMLRMFKSKTDSVQKRCAELHKRTMKMLDQMHKNTLNMIQNENYRVRNISKNHINISVRKQIEEIVIKNNALKKSTCETTNVKNKLVQTNYDLLETILQSQNDSKGQRQIVTNKTKIMERRPSPKAIRGPNYVANKVANKKSENIHSEPMITYKSHNYYTYQINHTDSNASYHSHKRIQNEKRTFITKQSRENFILPNEGPIRNNFKRKKNGATLSIPFQTHIKNLFKETSKLFSLKKHIIGATCESSYTIDFTESNRFGSINDRVVMSNLSKNTRMSIEDIRSQSLNYNEAASDNDVIAINTDTHVLPTINNNGYTMNDDCKWAFHGTYTIEKTEAMNNTESPNQVTKIDESVQNNRNFIFVSKSQENYQCEQVPDQFIDPMNVCETILNSEEIKGSEFEISFSNGQNHIDETNKQDSLYWNLNMKQNEEIQEVYEDQNFIQGQADCQNIISEVSHHFHIPNNDVTLNEATTYFKGTKIESPNPTSELKLDTSRQIIQEVNINKTVTESNHGEFNFMNRLCFVPKGMSPIFQNCKSKNTREYNLSRDYYEKEMYKNFAENVRFNAEVFEPKIQDANQVNTIHAIDKMSIKLVKENSALKFDGQSLKNSRTLGQIDEKFIAATMKETRNSEDSPDYLVLFDQHAVHERIRLESNLEDYFNENWWKAVPIHEVTLKLTKDIVLYLHNFKDKFEQLGLQWAVINEDEVSISTIPEAILGKNPRQVEKVIKAVRRLVIEEINIIKMQGGCVSLYPKSIMELVFSEACRYAIKFGDKLSKAECVELLKMLSACKVPFQCAHGRPVMAVVMEIKTNSVDYKIDIQKVSEWKRNKL